MEISDINFLDKNICSVRLHACYLVRFRVVPNTRDKIRSEGTYLLGSSYYTSVVPTISKAVDVS